jgi:hypothetical protein
MREAEHRVQALMQERGQPHFERVWGVHGPYERVADFRPEAERYISLDSLSSDSRWCGSPVHTIFLKSMRQPWPFVEELAIIEVNDINIARSLRTHDLPSILDSIRTVVFEPSDINESSAAMRNFEALVNEVENKTKTATLRHCKVFLTARMLAHIACSPHCACAHPHRGFAFAHPR